MMTRTDDRERAATPARSPLAEALARLGRDTDTRQLMLEAVKQWERQHEKKGESLRDTTTGYVVDALYSDVETVTRPILSSVTDAAADTRELSFTMLYRSKIAREFAMAAEPIDHAWEPQTTALLRRMAAGAKYALIGGAYSGDHAVPMMAEMADHGGTCICFEPNGEQAAMLEANATANGLDNYVLSNDGLWGETAQLVLVGFDSYAHPEIYRGQSGDVFTAVSIDDYCREHSIPSLDIIMLDIEGGEFEALKGAQRFLAALPSEAPDIVFEIHRAYVDWSDGLKETDICRLLLDNGYALYAIRDYQENVAMNGAAIEVVPIEKCYLEGPPHGFNIFASKRLDCVVRYALSVCENVSPKLLKHRDPALHQPLTPQG